jgi:hypothetical protein
VLLETVPADVRTAGWASDLRGVGDPIRLRLGAPRHAYIHTGRALDPMRFPLEHVLLRELTFLQKVNFSAKMVEHME